LNTTFNIIIETNSGPVYIEFDFQHQLAFPDAVLKEQTMTTRDWWVAFLVCAGVAAGGLDVGCRQAGDDANGKPPGSSDRSVVSDPSANEPSDAAVTDGGAGPQPHVFALSNNGHDRFYGVTFDASGRIYAAGRRTETLDAAEDVQSMAVRFTAAGTLDPTFGAGGVAKVNLAAASNAEFARGIVVQSTGKVVIAAVAEHLGGDARDRDLYLARFDANGELDKTFGTVGTGIVTLDLSDGQAFGDAGSSYARDDQWGLALGAADTLFLSGAMKRVGNTDTDYAVVKLDANGSKDPTFANGGVFALDVEGRSASPRSVTLLADGSVLMGGYMKGANDIVSPVLFKLAPSGALDTTFGVGGVYHEDILASAVEVYAAAPQGTNFVTAGYGRNAPSESQDWLSLRIGSDGRRDLAYGQGGVARLDINGQSDNARAVVVLPDQRVMLAGGSRSTATNANATLALLTKDGQPDPTFGSNGVRVYDLGGPGDFFWAVAVSPDKSQVAAVGLRGVDPDGGGRDEAALLLLPLPLR
jgi:uncharacterized delta-60 repeat protein